MVKKNKETIRYIPITERKKDLRIFYLGAAIFTVVVLSILIFYGISAYILTRPVELSGSIECNSGNIGLDYQSDYNISKVNYYDILNITTYKYDLQPKKFDIKGIKDLNCKVQFDSKNQLSNLIILTKMMEYLN